MIVGWKLSKSKTMQVTYSTLLKSFNFQPEFNGKIVSDSGRENIGSLPKKLIFGRGFVNQYNYKIPHSSLMGVTPAEKLNGVSVVSLKERFRQKLKANRLKRREEYQKCEDCRVRYVSDFNLQGRVLSS